VQKRLTAHLSRKKWDEISASEWDTILRGCTLSYIDVKAISYFLPSLLTALLIEATYLDFSGSVSFVLGPNYSRSDELWSGLTRRQREAVCAAIGALRSKYPAEFSEDFELCSETIDTIGGKR
jgi:hypothetical protein